MRVLSTSIFVLIVALAATAWAMSSGLSILPVFICVAAIGFGSEQLIDLWGPRIGTRLSVRNRDLLVRALFMLSLIVMTSAVMWPVPFELPVSQDHANHFLNTEIFWELLKSGHVFGWTDRIATGRPFGDSYGTLIYLLPTIPKILTFGLLSTGACYAISIWFVWFLGAWAVAGVTQKVIPDNRFAALLASAAFLLDVGADREGGWVYSMFHAVWPQWFASVLFLLSLWAVVNLWEKPTSRRLAWASIVIGVAVWMHPMNALNFVLFAPILALVLAGQDRKGRLVWVVLAHVLGAIVAAGWMIHMIVSRDSVGDYRASGTPLLELATHWWSGVVFENSAAIFGGLALVGLLALMRQRRAMGMVVLAAAAWFTLLQSMDLLTGFELGRWEGLPDLMWRRFVLTAKPFWFVMTGVGASVVANGLRNVAPGTKSPALLWLAAAPFLTALLMTMNMIAPAPAARPLNEAQAGLGATIDILTSGLKAESQRSPGRVAFWRDRGEDSEIPLIAIAKADLDYIATTVPPTQAFVYSNSGKDLPTLRALGVRWVISHGAANIEGAKEILRAPPYVLYRLDGEIAAYPVRMEGPGEVTVQSWSPMERLLLVKGATAKSHLEILHGPHSKWSATMPDGSHRSFTLARQGGWKFSRVSNLQNGVIRLEFHDSKAEIVFFWLAFGLLLALAGGVVMPSRGLPVLTVLRWVDGLIVGVTLVLLAGSGVFLFLAGQQALNTYWAKGEPQGTEVLKVLHQHQPDTLSWSPTPYCVRPYSRNPRVGCIESDLEPRLDWDGATNSSCMRFGVPDRGETNLKIAVPSGTTAVKALATLDRTVTMEISSKGTTKKIESGLPFRIPASGTVSVKAKNTGGTANVCLEWVAVGKP